MTATTVRQHRAGFTLLELIIASGLMATLLVLVWSLFGIYTKLSDKGIRKATELQLARALNQQLRADLRQILPERRSHEMPYFQGPQPEVAPMNDAGQPHLGGPRPIGRRPIGRRSFGLPQTSVANSPPSQTTTALDSSSESNTALTTRDVSSFTDESTGNQLPDGPAFWGTATRMEFFIQARRESPIPTMSSSDTLESRFLPDVYDHVTYRWRSPSVTDSYGDEDTLRETTFDETDSTLASSAALFDEERKKEPSVGLTRTVISWLEVEDFSERDDFLMTTEPETTASSALSGSARETTWKLSPEVVDEVPEVSSLRFRYFDGRGWRSRWDSQESGRLPVAIEVIMVIEDPDHRAKRTSDGFNRQMNENPQFSDSEQIQMDLTDLDLERDAEEDEQLETTSESMNANSDDDDFPGDLRNEPIEGYRFVIAVETSGSAPHFPRERAP